MSRWVVDASVAVKWLLPEEHREQARILLEEDHDRVAPDLILLEVGNALWKRVRRNQLAPGDAVEAFELFSQLPLQLEGAATFAPITQRIALHTEQTMYDCLYLAMAVAYECPLVTADAQLFRAIAGGPMKSHIRWIEEIS